MRSLRGTKVISPMCSTTVNCTAKELYQTTSLTAHSVAFVGSGEELQVELIVSTVYQSYGCSDVSQIRVARSILYAQVDG